MNEDPLIEAVQRLLTEEQPGGDWKETVGGLLQRVLDQNRLLDRLTRISDHFQAAEREKSQNYLERYERQVRQLEKIVRISDRYQHMLQEMKERLEYASNFDILTGLPNRRFMTNRLNEAIAQANRLPDTGFLLMLADLDHFKRINDKYGHGIGDSVLQRTASILSGTLREYDVCARWGGEEFLLLFPCYSGNDGSALARRLCQAVENGMTQDGTCPMATISIGYTVYIPGESVDITLQRADKALYEAKATGRNCFCGL